MTLFLTKNLDLMTKSSSLRPFLASSYFPSHPIIVHLKIIGGTNTWAVPHLKVLETVPPNPSKSPPVFMSNN